MCLIKAAMNFGSTIPWLLYRFAQRLNRQTKIAADDILTFFYNFYLSKKIRHNVQVLFSFKKQ